ncbi:G-type lectin S-receptor-like serine/threonine-protein kinase B120 [Cynara cardunculus var. scolymus]|uniref:G-type lectin S-receptor-like serine/threonine-protein kinase B120 n=1 Tax=Cynara cardunculus var. scolymus TaxID=59895 RepID=UPI000D62A36F|nr:G-type lectin S-receptor-like serine/threonine-protein kinase B120 [Cynara cardunculus var. scolymus]
MGFSFNRLTNLHLVSFFLLLFNLRVFSQLNNSSIRLGDVIRDGETIVSENQIFQLGFFSPRNSSFRYVGIWYYGMPDQTVTWVANRDAPISGDSGVFGIQSNGGLSISDQNGTVYWSTDSFPEVGNVTVMLVDTGNLILSTVENAGDDRNALWQSCEHPTDTYLPNMRVYVNITTGDSASFVSWRTPNDPSTGNYSMVVDPRGSPQIVTWDNSRRRIWRSGQWNQQIFTGLPQMRSLLLSGFRLVQDDGGLMYFIFNNPNRTLLMRFMIQWNGVVQQLTWDEGRLLWVVPLSLPSTQCQEYNRCGSYGICSLNNSPSVCSCMQGFELNSSDQCTRRTPLECGTNSSTSDGFLRTDGVKLPDFGNTFMAQNQGECEDGCSRNCSCDAYAYVSGVGCLIWGGDLIDIEQFEEGGETLFVRLAGSELGGGNTSQTVVIAISITGTIVLGVFIWITWRYRRNIKEFTNLCGKKMNFAPLVQQSNGLNISANSERAGGLSVEGKPFEGTLYSLATLESATDGFANKNKLGEGGFGPVHKGILPGGQKIAVKRLSKWSGQGLMEFKNEMILIAKLQHRNLVRLLGYCIDLEENMLVYEYMPNKSLDTFLFDMKKKEHLDWKTRFLIIEGIARGLLYLHRDSRLRIIHRDLKASNILLDEDMNPKISDFGMARIFGGNQNEANTVRVVGTYGYMSPEYAMEGLFSVKSDVYSFGVLLLEIISGQRNTGFHAQDSTNLIQHAWNLWKNGKPEELIDPSILDSCNKKEALQCIHVGMLCVQFSAVHRPTMSSVVYMLESENRSLPLPTQVGNTSLNADEMDLVMEGRYTTFSSNDITFTEVVGR